MANVTADMVLAFIADVIGAPIEREDITDALLGDGYTAEKNGIISIKLNPRLTANSHIYISRKDDASPDGKPVIAVSSSAGMRQSTSFLARKGDTYVVTEQDNIYSVDAEISTWGGL